VEESSPGHVLRQHDPGPGKGETVSGAPASERHEVLAAEDLTERSDRQQEAGVAGLPLGPIKTQASTGHEAVHVARLRQRLAPALEDRRDPEFCPPVLRVTGLAPNFSPMPRIAPPPLGSEIAGVELCSLSCASPSAHHLALF
jgi:hypothetical protein